MHTKKYTTDEQQILHSIARQSIHNGLAQQQPLTIIVSDYPDALQQQRATFVTLNINKQLRGCIGSLTPYRALVDDIAHNARAAAFSDPRFPALTEAEFALLDYHLSILSDTTAMQFSSEADLAAQIRPGIDGLVLSDGYHKGTFLPSVWEQLPTVTEFLQQLKRKAGLPAEHWSDTLQVSRYTVESF